MLKNTSFIVVIVTSTLFSAFLLLEEIAPFWGPKPSEILSIKLTESTRGTFRSIIVTYKNRTISFNNDQQELPTKPNDWKKIVREVEKLSIPKLNEIKVTSKRHQVDAALHATLTLETTEGTFTTPTFDHNTPPEELEAVIACLYSQIPPKMRDLFQ